MNPISINYGSANPYSIPGYGAAAAAVTMPGTTGRPVAPETGTEKANGIDGVKEKNVDGTQSTQRECQTCNERKYQDGSDEMVSFKSASHISPEAAPTAVRAHEQEHVSNAYKKASQGDGEVIRASVTIHTAICPECGRSYVSGGTTATQIKYSNEENPYQKMKKASEGFAFRGTNVDATV